VFRDDHQKNQIESWIKEGSIPHLLFSGSAGVGKTTMAKILIEQLGVQHSDVLYANGSKEARKIEWVDKLINFCQTMAFGDGGNDITMLKYVALGVAMGNANPEVKAIADYVTDDVDNDGILKALKHFGIID
jgi:hydroxymethylpyrimidine pyrophosphatase-like HAD family hydrolase